MIKCQVRFILSICFVLVGFATVPLSAAEPFEVSPVKVDLQGNFAQAQLLVTKVEDLTHSAKYTSSNPKVVSVNESGRLLAVGDGQAVVKITAAGATRDISVTVAGVLPEPIIDYNRQINPLFSKLGCNMGACHASQFGKGGFVLSVFGFAPEKDHPMITRDRTMRRINRIDPEQSLLLLKPTMQVPHGGSMRLRKGSVDYQTLLAWIQGGTVAPKKDAPEVDKLTVTPARRVGKMGTTQQLRVEAHYSDGTSRDVTAWAKFDSMDGGLLAVSEEGLVTATGKGQAPIMIRFEGQADLSMFVIPYADNAKLAGWKNNNFVDEHASNKFRELGVEPSPLCDDATFLRRAFLDATGSLPTVAETTAFLESKDPNRRNNLVDRLLGLTGDSKLDIYNDRYAAHWSLKWSDLIRNDSRVVGEQGMWSMHNWIKESFRTNKSFDKFVRELVTAKGSIYSNGPANYFRINNNSSNLTEATAQLFLGVRMECAKCHHHPFEKYSQADYYSFASFFARVGTKGSEEFGLFGREQVVIVRNSGDTRHPRTRELMKPTPLGGEPTDHPLDRRIALADWLTSPDNDFFARNVVNRYVSYLLGRGLVEPVDDMRGTNPPSNVALMDALAKDYVAHKFDLKHLMRTIMTSRLYQLSSQPTAANESDRRFYSYYKVKRLKAEPLLDAIDQVTGKPTKFKNLPLGTRAIELPDAEYPNYFLKTFAKPLRASVCECERSPDANLAQALHTLNGDILATKITAKDARIAKLLAAKKPHDEIVGEIYLATLNRHPSDKERAAAKTFLDSSPNPKEFYEDLLWALVNSKQFLFVH